MLIVLLMSPPVGSRGIVRTAMCASCLRRLRPVLICEAHSFETCPLNHAPLAASTPLLATSFCMEAGTRRRRRRRPPCIPRPRGQPPLRRDPASSVLRPSPLRVARRGGLAYPLDQCLRSAEYRRGYGSSGSHRQGVCGMCGGLFPPEPHLARPEYQPRGYYLGRADAGPRESHHQRHAILMDRRLF